MTLRVLLQQPALPHYRVPVFRALDARPGLRLTVIYGTRPGLRNASPDGLDATLVTDRALEVRGRRLIWQHEQVRAAAGGYDVLVMYWDLHFASLPPSILIARARGSGVVLWGHGYSKQESPFRRRARVTVGKMAHALLFYDDHTCESYARAGFRRERLFVAPNTMDTSASLQAQSSWSARAIADFRTSQQLQQFTVLFVSRLEEDNGLRLLLRAVALLRVSGCSVTLVVIGDGAGRAALEREAELLRINDCVRFLGAIYDESQLAPWFIASSVFCYPENIGLSLIHAFSYGLPVITSDWRCAQGPEFDALSPGVNGMVFRHRDLQSLVSSLRDLSTSPDLRNRLSAGARETHRRRSVAAMVNGLEAAIRYAAALRT